MSLPKGGILIACLNIIQIGFYNRGIIGETIIEGLSIGFFVELDVESLRSLNEAVFGAGNGNGTHPMSLPKGGILICGYPGSVRIKLPSLWEGLGVGFYFP